MDRYRRLPWSAGGILAIAVLVTGCSSAPTGSPIPSAAAGPTITFSEPISLPGGGELLDALPWRDGYLGVALAPLRFDGLAEASAEILLTLDARTWAVVDTGDALRNVQPLRLLKIGDGLVLVGSTWSPDSGASSPATFASSDGREWVATTADGMSLVALRFAAGNGSVVAAAGANPDGSAAIWRTGDGRTWEPVTLGDDPPDVVTVSDLAGGPDGFVIGGTLGPVRPPGATPAPGDRSAALWSSSDGARWNRVQTVPGSGTYPMFGQLLVTPTATFASGSTGTELLTVWSADLETWTQAAEGEAPPPLPFGLHACASVGCLILATNQAREPTAIASPDGHGWTSIIYGDDFPVLDYGTGTGLEPKLFRLIAAGDRLVAAGTVRTNPVIWLVTLELPAAG